MQMVELAIPVYCSFVLFFFLFQRAFYRARDLDLFVCGLFVSVRRLSFTRVPI